MKKQKTDWEKVKEQYKDWCFYNKQHLGRMFDSEAFWDFYLKQTLQQQRKEIIKEIEGILKDEWEDPDIRGSKIEDSGSYAVTNPVVRNQLRKEIRDRLKQITNLKEK